MKFNIKDIWLPMAVVAIASIQALASTESRLSPVREIEKTKEALAAPDTVIYNNSKIFSKFRTSGELTDSTLFQEADSTLSDSTEVFLTARDTIHAPDSLRETDPFRYKYYVALIDSLTHKQVRDSLRNEGDSLIWPKIDSIYYADSAFRAIEKFNRWYNSLSKSERKNYDFTQKMKIKQARMDSILNVKDSLKAIRDSITEYTPRVLETFTFPDSMHYKRIITWNRDDKFSNVTLQKFDTTYNFHYNDYPIYKNDVGATYLGVIGSASQTYDWFKRTSEEGVYFYDPYQVYTYTPSTLPMYNTKTPYTELAYWGTIFSNDERQENNLHILTTQNFWPHLNFTLEYDRFGSNGMLLREKVDNRTLVASMNWTGKRYLAHFGYIYNKMGKNENGGIVDNFWIRDTIVGSREIDVRLQEATTLIKKNTVFLDQTYRIPFTFLKNLGEMKEKRQDKKYRDSVIALGDTAAIAKMEEMLAERASERASRREARDSIDTDVTTAFIGHSSEYTAYRKIYTDKIGLNDNVGRSFYENFYINPTTTMDSIRVMKFENKVFLKLQPWSSEGIVSSLNVGIGDRLLSYYMFQPLGYIKDKSNTVWNSAYIYGGTGGQISKYFKWDAEGWYTFLGPEINDVGLKANAKVSIFPFRKDKNSPIVFDASFETSLDEPEYFQQHYYSNHYAWDNDFGKISTTRIEAGMSIPRWNLNVRGGYAILANTVYYDSLSVIRQHSPAMSVAKLAITKNFNVLHNHLHFDNTVLGQWSSNQEVMPLPAVAANLRWYFQMDVVKSVMQMQLGANATWNTKWKMPGYNPALGTFYNQNKEEYGMSPYIDIFMNVQWKRACVFLKIININKGWPIDKKDYFSADGYIKPQTAFKIGIWWPFYMQSSKNSTINAGGGSGGNRKSR